ncbi:hypothetical protein [Streptomyces odontomachi]|uniref:hypothetical protein n=1 Tax=Streptomyces odontomachi TaxID=2944940 RepID=UPI00210EA63B|nr:hypothetical protein [Streptomyces sp. ODS25]
MQLALGDVVRDRTDLALGTVAGVANHPGGSLVAVCLPGDAVRLCPPSDLDVVARYARPVTTRQGVIALGVILLGFVGAYVGSDCASELGASWPLVVMSGLGGYTAVTTAYEWALRLTGPRRFRV